MNPELDLDGEVLTAEDAVGLDLSSFWFRLRQIEARLRLMEIRIEALEIEKVKRIEKQVPERV